MTPAMLTCGDFSYFSYTGSANIVFYSGNETNLVIPETLDGITVTSIGGLCRSHSSFDTLYFTSISIPDCVTSINYAALSRCTSLTLIVGSGSYAEKFAIKYGFNYVVNGHRRDAPHSGKLGKAFKGLLERYFK